MGIIRDEDIKAREDYLDAEERRNNPVKYALLELEHRKSLIVPELIESARKQYVKSGTVRGRTTLRFTDSECRVLEGLTGAQDLIASWLEDVDPSFRVNVKIGPDCSGNYRYESEVVAEFYSK